MDDKHAQREEIEALGSIYEETELFSFDEKSNKGTFYIKIESNASNYFTINFGISLQLLKNQNINLHMNNFHQKKKKFQQCHGFLSNKIRLCK